MGSFSQPHLLWCMSLIRLFNSLVCTHFSSPHPNLVLSLYIVIFTLRGVKSYVFWQMCRVMYPTMIVANRIVPSPQASVELILCTQPLLLNPGNYWFGFCPNSFIFCRISCKCLYSFSKMYLRFIHGFLWISTSLFFIAK